MRNKAVLFAILLAFPLISFGVAGKGHPREI